MTKGDLCSTCKKQKTCAKTQDLGAVILCKDYVKEVKNERDN